MGCHTAMLWKFLEDKICGLEALFELSSLVQSEKFLEQSGLFEGKLIFLEGLS